MQPAQIVVLGASGDLTSRKLVPAIAGFPEALVEEARLQVVGCSRSPKSDESWREELGAVMPEEQKAGWRRVAPRMHYQRCDLESGDDLRALARRLDELARGEPTGRLFYLALKPDLFVPAVEKLTAAGLLEQGPGNGHGWRRVVIEKPFGHDGPSARELNRKLHELLFESQIYRIDHYLGKETVQNLLGLRFHNAIFEPLWNRHHVELVQITVAEDIGVEGGRGRYYDGVGAVRDMLQNHMLQVLALVAMEPPSTMDAEALRDEKVEALRSLRLLDAVDARTDTVRARYAAGVVSGASVCGYLQEEGVAPDSQTETYVAVRTELESWRWGGVPILLRHGKRLAKKLTEVRVQFRTPPIQLFNRPDDIPFAEFRRQLRDGKLCQIRPNVLTMTIQPRESIELSFGVKRPGPSMVMAPAELKFDYQERFGKTTAPAYQRLLLDALAGDATLFLRNDEIDASWRFADALHAAWQAPDAPPVLEYEAGSWGPEQAENLHHGCEGGWSDG